MNWVITSTTTFNKKGPWLHLKLNIYLLPKNIPIVHHMISSLLKMATTIEFVNRLLASGSYRDILSIVKGFRNGIVLV